VNWKDEKQRYGKVRVAFELLVVMQDGRIKNSGFVTFGFSQEK